MDHQGALFLNLGRRQDGSDDRAVEYARRKLPGVHGTEGWKCAVSSSMITSKGEIYGLSFGIEICFLAPALEPFFDNNM